VRHVITPASVIKTQKKLRNISIFPYALARNAPRR
jgi:hypothetical protein